MHEHICLHCSCSYSCDRFVERDRNNIKNKCDSKSEKHSICDACYKYYCEQMPNTGINRKLIIKSQTVFDRS